MLVLRNITLDGGSPRTAFNKASFRLAPLGAEGILNSDLLHAIRGMPWRTLLLGAFAAGQGQSTTVRWAPLLSLAVPCFMPQTCPKGASEGPAWRDGKAADRSRGLPECRSTSA
jgi:hypothetical protein